MIILGLLDCGMLHLPAFLMAARALSRRAGQTVLMFALRFST